MNNLIASSQLTIVVGLGVTGLSAARFLQKNNIRFMVMDSRQAPPNLEAFNKEFPDISVMLGCLDVELLASASEIIISPGMSLQTPEIAVAINKGISVVGDIELFARYVDKPVIAITGSNAKSTVTTLVGEMAKAAGYNPAVGGNLGVPVLDMLDDKTIDLFVLELSSFQLESTFSLKSKVATILNVSLDHMDRYNSVVEYHQAKQRIYRYAEQVLVNRQDPLTYPPLAKDATVWSFGNDRPDIKGFGLVAADGECFLTYQFKKLMPVSELSIKGRHNYVNALSALALGMAAGFDIKSMLATLKTFKGLSHRCEHVATIGQVDYINDSKATNVGATLAAIEGFSHGDLAVKNIILIAGGDGKGADFSPLREPIKQYVKLVILIGADADKIMSALDSVVEIKHAASLEDAVSASQQLSQQGDVVLLSPACASFDMFSGFEDRGNQFALAVEGCVA